MTVPPGQRARFTLFEPSGRITDVKARHQARLVAALAFVLALLALQGVIATTHFAPPGLSDRVPSVLMVSTLLYVLAYFLARFVSGAISIHVTLATQLLTPLAVGLVGPTPPLSVAAWLSLAILTANVTLDRRAVLAVGAAAVGGQVLVNALTHQNPSDTAQGAMFLVATTSATFVYCWYRDRLERMRRAELETKNQRLETLGATLELRVAARTAELNKSRIDLEATLSFLQQSQDVLLQSEKMAAVGRLTAGFAHELSSPLGAVVASMCELKELADELGQTNDDPSFTPEDRASIVKDMSEAIATADVASKRAVAFVRGIKAHTRAAESCDPEWIDVPTVVREVLDIVGYAARAARAQVAFHPVHSIRLCAPPSRLSQALANIVSNAIDAVGERGGGKVEVNVHETNSEVCVAVRDDGPGILPEHLPLVCEPLFTTKPLGKGTGLGLAVARDIIQSELGGRLEVDSEPGDTTFQIWLPKREKS
jgi:C4-dicarboxylate-specific signal transduction histidine kinase